jgi:hypothetical protein
MTACSSLIVMLGAALLVGCAAGTGRAHDPSPADSELRIQLLGFDGCPLSPRMRENLHAALADLDASHTLEVIDLQLLPLHHPLLRWAAPTVLVNGADLFDQPPMPRPALACRTYPFAGGVPDAPVIAQALRQRSAVE